MSPPAREGDKQLVRGSQEPRYHPPLGVAMEIRALLGRPTPLGPVGTPRLSLSASEPPSGGLASSGADRGATPRGPRERRARPRGASPPSPARSRRVAWLHLKETASAGRRLPGLPRAWYRPQHPKYSGCQPRETSHPSQGRVRGEGDRALSPLDAGDARPGSP